MKVLDSSAVLAFTYTEAGHTVVKPLLEHGHISAANWSEVLQKLAVHGSDPDRQGKLLLAIGLTIEPLTAEDAAAAARLYTSTQEAGLSLGDRCCLALAKRLGVPAVTADRAWAGLDIEVSVELIR